METREFQTSLGVIPLTGRFTDRTKVMAINGFAAPPEEMSRLPVLVEPGYDGVVAFLPGDRNPALAETSIAAWARAFDEVVEQLGPTVLLGHSAGGVVALAMRSPLIRAVVALDPPLLPAKMWPVIPEMRAALNTHYGPAIDALFGVTPEGIEPRDYRPLLSGLHRPTYVIVGSDPLYPERPIDRHPSLVDVPERALYAAHPLITLQTAANSGHKLQYQAGGAVAAKLLEVCARHAPT